MVFILNIYNMPKKFSKTFINKSTGKENTVKYWDSNYKIWEAWWKRANSYCARSNNIKWDWRSDPNSPNNLSRAKWKCKGNVSMRKSKMK